MSKVAKGTSPLLGYNTNIRHKGVLCHVQTEDSGVHHPHVITHLFTAGTIISTRKRSYKEHVESEDLESTVRKLMQEQHKAMCIALRDGEFDGTLPIRDTVKIDTLPPEPPAAPAPAVEPPPPPPTPPDPKPARARAATPRQPPSTPPFDDPAPPESVRSKPTPPAATTYRAKAEEIVQAPSASPRSGATPAPPVRRGATPLPPTDPDAGRYSSKNPALFGGGKRSPTPAPPAREPRRRPTPSSIFGQEYISEKSLDEVILAYLSEEVDEK